MIDRDNGVRPSSSARDAPADFMAVLGGNDNRYTAAESTRPGCRLKAHSHGELGGIPIVESDVLILDRRAFGGDGFGVAGLVVLVARGGVVGGDGEASRVARDFKAVAAVGADIDFLRRIDGRPHPRRGDHAAFCRVGGFGRGDYLAFYDGCVGFWGAYVISVGILA